MAGPGKRKSFLERCTSALVPSNWGIKSNWAKIPLTIVSPIWVGPGALGCYAAHEVIHLSHLAQLLVRNPRGLGGLPSLESPTALRNPMNRLTPTPTFRAAQFGRDGTGGSSGGLGHEDPFDFDVRSMGRRSLSGDRGLGMSGLGAGGATQYGPRTRPDLSGAGGLIGFDARLSASGLETLRFGRRPDFDRPLTNPTAFSTGGLRNFDTRVGAPALGGPMSPQPTSFGTGGLANFDTRLNVPGLNPGFSR